MQHTQQVLPLAFSNFNFNCNFLIFLGDSLFLYCGDKIPQLKSRVFKSGAEAQGQGGAKKKGKGGRR